MPDEFQNTLEDPSVNVSDKEIIKEIEADNEKDYLRQLKKKNKEYLVPNLTLLERERIAGKICSWYKDALPKHKDLCDKIDEHDETFRMVRKSVLGDDGDMPNYTTPLSTVTVEVVHANIMNVFFTPKDIMRVIPTEEGDIPKVKKLSVFGNFSAKNELDIFDQCDKLFHSSGKNGESPYIMHWVKEYGTEIQREVIMSPADPKQPLIDPDTQQPVFQETEKQKLLYNAPRLEVFSRKDYIQPKSAVMDRKPAWEMRIVRITADEYYKDQLAGKMYAGSIQEIKDWAQEDSDTDMVDYDGTQVPTAAYEKEFIEFYGTLRVKAIKNDDEGDEDVYEELSDEYIGLVNVESGVLCSLRKNKFPMKERPIGMDYFIPDDEGRRAGLGVMEMMDGPQKCYDALYNQYVFGTIQSNNPVIFFTPMGNIRNEPMKIKNGYMFPSADPSSVNMFQFPQPGESITKMLELVNYWAQMLFGVSNYSAGMESTIDPDAPAKKAEILVAQGSVRLNMIIKRKNKTLNDIFRRWYLLYKENMPPNKFMRVAGASEEEPWEFNNIEISDFSLASTPDFELTGNILNSNKSLEAQKKIAIYNMLIQNPFFQPTSAQGMQALHALTKWLTDGLEETGLSRFLPEMPGETVHTPEEENARFMQGDEGEPSEGDDHIKHMKVHRALLIDPTMPEEIKKQVAIHLSEHIKMLQQLNTQRIAMQQMGVNPNQPNQGVNNGQQGQQGQGAPNQRPGPQGTPGRVLPGQQANMGRPSL